MMAKCIYKPTSFEWDENKRNWTIESRGLDFIDAQMIFDSRNALTAPSSNSDERRFVSVAMLDNGKFYSVVGTWRGDVEQRRPRL